MGGSPAPTVANIKNLVYMNHTGEGEAESQPRAEYLGEYIFVEEVCDAILIFTLQLCCCQMLLCQ